MNIYQKAASILGAIAQGDEGAIATLIQVIKKTQNEYTCREAVESLGKIAQGYEGAIAALIQVIKNTQNEYTCRKAVESLGKIAQGNQGAIAALIQLLKNTQDESTRREVAESLGKIDVGNKEAIIALIQIIKNTKYDITRKGAAESLGKIAQGNKEVITALIQAIKNTQDEYSCWSIVDSLSKITQGDEEAIATLIQVVKTISQNNNYKYTYWKIPEILNTIAQQNDREDIAALIQVIKRTEYRRIPPEIVSPWEQDRTSTFANQILETVQSEDRSGRKAANRLQEQEYAQVVFALKDRLSNEAYQNDFNLYENSFKIIWNCAQNLPYPIFYQAWHHQLTTPHPEVPETTGVGSTPFTQSLNLADLPNILDARLVETQLIESLQLICIDTSKFIDSQNPALDIYGQFLDKNCPQHPNRAPETLAQLKFYWNQLRRDSDKHPILIFYQDPTSPAAQGFSPTFLDALTRFDGTICLIADTPHPPLQTFSPHDSDLLQTVVNWLKRLHFES